MQVKKQQLKLDKKQRTSSKLGKEYVKVVYYYPIYLTFMQSTSCEILGVDVSQSGINIAGGEISTTSDMQMIPL